MKHLLSMSILVIAVVGCRQSAINSANGVSTPLPTPSPTPIPATKTPIFDVLKLIGKSQTQIKAILGEPISTDKLNPTDTTGEISFDYKFDRASSFINFKNGKVNYVHFESKEKFKLVFELGDLVGVDLRGVVPAQSNAAQITYRGKIQGVDFSEIRASTDGEFSIITFRVK